MFKTILGTKIYLSTKNFKPSYKFSKLSYERFNGNFEFQVNI